jgi:hypothetical protein
MHLQARRSYVVRVGREPPGSEEGQTRVIERQRVERHRAVGRPAHPACLVAGCTCKDARIVSHRRAAFFAAWARDHGETADRVVALDPAWSIAPANSDPVDGDTTNT